MKISRPINDPAQSKNDSNAEELAANIYEGKRGKQESLLNSLSWMSVPLLLLLIVLTLYNLNPSETYQYPRLSFLLGLVFTTFGGVLVAFLAGRSFLSQSMPSLLMLGCGALILGSGSVVATGINPKDINGQIAVYNICIWLSAFCHLAGALINPKQTKAMSRAPGVWLGLALLFSLFLVWITRVFVIDGVVPPFFIQGQGGTPLRQIVLISAIGMFILSATLLKQPKPNSTGFSNWYALALVLIAIGLLGVLLQRSQASLIGWTGRAAQYLGGACMLIAAAVSVRETRTWRITVEAMLQETKRQYESLVDLAADGILIHEVASEDTRHRIIQANPALCNLLGYTLREIQSMTLGDITVPEDHAAVPKRLQPITDEKALRYEETFIAKDGRRVPVEISSRLFLRDARPVAMSIVRDFTERKRAEEALRREEGLLKNVMQTTDVMLVLLDPQFNFVWVNPAYAETCQMKLEELVGKNHFVLYPHAENEAIFRKVRNTGEGVFYKDKPFVFPDQPEREVTYWDWSLTPAKDASGNVTGLVFSLRETTKFKQAELALLRKEAELREAHRLAHVGSWYWDAQTDATIGSDELLRIYGFDPATQAMPNFREQRERCYPVEDWERVNEAVQRTMETAVGYELDVQVLRNGTRIWVTTRGEVVRNADGRIVGLRGTVQDITARKQAEEELRQLNLSLEQRVSERTTELAHTIEVLQEEISQRVRAENELKLANEQLAQRADQLRRLAGELTVIEQTERKRLSRILHDGLQQHLASAKIQLGGLAEQVENEDLKRTADEIERIISEGLSMSRSLNAELSPPILHEGGLSEGLEWLTRWMREKHRFSVDLTLGAAPELREDAKILVFESVRELLFNALKHAQVSRAQVHLELVGNGEMRVTVSDEGAGFDPCRLLPAGDGGGFGLFSIRERIGLFGGRLEIDSAPGRGSRVMLTVPYFQANTAQFLMDDVCAPVIVPPRGAAEDQETKIRVLLVDDHALFRNGIARLLKNEPGLEVVGEAKDGQEAIEFAQKHMPNVILMDISMPGINGIEATRVIHEQHPEVCIIGLSMYDDPEKERAMRAAGATKYMSKGCAGAELVAAIRAGLQTRKPSSKLKLHTNNQVV